MTVTIPVVAADGAQSTVTLPAPNVGGTPIAQFSDLSGAFVPAWLSPVAAHAPQFQAVSTPNGPGFQFAVADTDVATWDSTMKDVLGQKFPDNGTPMLTETPYTFNFSVYLPTQSIVTSWNGGVVWEYHTTASSGHHVGLDATGRGPTNPAFRFGRQSAAGESYAYTYAPLTFNTWHQFTLNFKWSLTTDGYYQLSMDGTQYINFSGQTIFSGEGTPYLQFGFYADIGSKKGVASVGTNQVTIAGITYST